MSRVPLVILVLAALTGCAVIGPSQPLVISPTPRDWEAAFSRLPRDEQSAIKDGEQIIDSTGVPLDGNIYSFSYGPPSGHPIETERLNISAICHGYNELFSDRSGNAWKLVSAVTFVGYGSSEGGTQSHTFELRWEFAKEGRTLSVSAKEEGPGVKIIFGAAPEAITAEANQAFALTFLKLMVQLRQAKSDG